MKNYKAIVFFICTINFSYQIKAYYPQPQFFSEWEKVKQVQQLLTKEFGLIAPYCHYLSTVATLLFLHERLYSHILISSSKTVSIDQELKKTETILTELEQLTDKVQKFLFEKYCTQSNQMNSVHMNEKMAKEENQVVSKEHEANSTDIATELNHDHSVLTKPTITLDDNANPLIQLGIKLLDAQEHLQNNTQLLANSSPAQNQLPDTNFNSPLNNDVPHQTQKKNSSYTIVGIASLTGLAIVSLITWWYLQSDKPEVYKIISEQQNEIDSLLSALQKKSTEKKEDLDKQVTECTQQDGLLDQVKNRINHMPDTLKAKAYYLMETIPKQDDTQEIQEECEEKKLAELYSIDENLKKCIEAFQQESNEKPRKNAKKSDTPEVKLVAKAPLIKALSSDIEKTTSTMNTAYNEIQKTSKELSREVGKYQKKQEKLHGKNSKNSQKTIKKRRNSYSPSPKKDKKKRGSQKKISTMPYT